MFRTLSLLLVPLALVGCAVEPPAWHCSASQRQVNDLLYFGTAQPQGVVGAEQWADFLRTTVTPRFPQGLTVWPAAGQWQAANGRLVEENTWVLQLLHPGGEVAEQHIQAIVADYKTRFQQEAVLRVRSMACVSLSN